jgi:hypothetical protein
MHLYYFHSIYSLLHLSFFILFGIGALVTAIGGIYYRDTIKEKLCPSERSAMDSAKKQATEIRHDISQGAK